MTNKPNTWGVGSNGERDYMRKRLFKTLQNAPPSTGVGICNLSAAPDIELITGGVALLPGTTKREPLKYNEAD